jgi:hypothetical protein
MSSKLLREIKQEISRREKELKILIDVANTLANMQGGRGRKSKFSFQLPQLLNSNDEAKTERRGRPKGSKNKPGAKKTGPKSKNSSRIEKKKK